MHQTGTRDYLRGALWVYPSIAVGIALLVGAILSSIDVPPDSWVERLLFQGTSDDARTLLVGISGTMMTVIALVLGLTLVALQLSSVQFSPRLLRHFLRDRSNQLVLSTFVATFTYATAGLYTVGVDSGTRTDTYPRLAVTLAIVLLFASLLVLIWFVHHVSHSIQVDEVMAGVEARTLQVIRDDLPTDGVGRLPVPDPGEGAVEVPAYRSGYVQTLDPAALVRSSVEYDVTWAMTHMVGQHVVQGAPLALAWPRTPGGRLPPESVLERAVHDGVRLGYERTTEQDVAFGVRQLADIAVKALSPAVNDPYTAIQATEHLASLLVELAERPLGDQVLTEDGVARVAMPGRDLEYFVELATGQIRRYGANEPRVMNAVLRVLETVGRFCPDPDRTVVVRHVRLVMDAAALEIRQPEDLSPVTGHGERILAGLGATVRE